MNLISKLKNWATNTVSSYVNQVNYQWVNNTIQNQIDNVEAYIKKGYQLNADAYSIMSFIAGKAATVPFILYEVQDDKALRRYKSLTTDHYSTQNRALKTKALKEVSGEHPIMRMLNKAPNEQMTASEFKFGWVLYRLATGNSLVRGFAPENQPGKFVELHMLPTQWTVALGGGQYNALRAYKMTWNAEEIPSEQVSHSRYFNPDFEIQGNPFVWGQAPLKAASSILNRANSGIEATTKAYQNGGMAGILYQDGGQDLSEPQREMLQQHIDNKVAGSGNYKQILAASAKMGWLKIGESPVDLGILDTLIADLRTLCNVFHVNSALFNDPENKTFNNMTEARKAAITDAVIPELTALRDALNTWLIPGWEKADNKKYFVDYDASVFPELQDNMKELAEWLNIAWWLTPNQKLEQMDYPTLGSDYDVPFLPVGIAPLGSGSAESDVDFTKAFNGVGNIDYE